MTVSLAGRSVPVATAEDVALLKLLEGGNAVHLDDLLLVVGPLDDAYLAAWADKLGVRDRLEEQWRRAGRVLRS